MGRLSFFPSCSKVCGAQLAKRGRSQILGRCTMTDSPLQFLYHWYMEGFDSSCFTHHLGVHRCNVDIFPIKKEKVCKLKKKIDWIHFGSVFYKQHKAYLSSLLTQKHICVEVFCFSFFTGRLISKPSDFVIFQFPSFLPLDNQFLTNSSFLHSFIHFINSINIY